MLAAKDDQGLRGCYVACDTAGQVVAMATTEYPGMTPYDRVPDGTIRQVVKQLGYAATARLLMVGLDRQVGQQGRLAFSRKKVKPDCRQRCDGYQKVFCLKV